MNTSFERSANGKDEWLTPPNLIKRLGEFDLDPCSPVNRPWDMAKHHYTIQDNGLGKPWFGRVWLNPPYGTQTQIWLARLAAHGNGIALTFARTETRMFVENVWREADAVLFIYGRLTFHNVDGTRARNSAGAGSCLIAYGRDNVVALEKSDIGKFIRLTREESGKDR